MGRLRTIRKNLGLTQVELEKLLGLGRKVVTRWERGINPPNPATLRLLFMLERNPGLISKLALASNDAKEFKRETQ